MSRTTRHFLLLLILLLAAALRIYHIDLQSLWIDEGFTWNLTQYHDPFRILANDVHPPLYFVLIDIWVNITGTSVVAMRFFSVLPSMLSVAVIYQIAREIERQRGINSGGVIPLLAALLLALADSEGYLAKEMRGYTLQVLWASLSMWGFLRWWRLRTWRNLALWIVSTSALVYTFYLAALVGVVQGVYVLLFGGNLQRDGLIKRGQAISALIVAALTLIPWLLLTIGEQSGNLSYAEWIRPDAFGFWLNDFRVRYFGDLWFITLGLALLGLMLVRQRKASWRIQFDPPIILLLLWVGLPLLLTLLANLAVPLYQPRRIVMVVPAIILLMAFGLGALPRYPRLLLIAVISIYSVFTIDYWRYKQEWQSMAEATAPTIAPSIPILFELGGDDYAPRYHYGQTLPQSHDMILQQEPQSLLSNPLVGLTTWRHLDPDTYAGGLPAYIDSQQHFWFFYWSSDTGALDWLQSLGFTRTATLTVDFNPDVFLYRYDRIPDEPLVRYANGLILWDADIYTNGAVDFLWGTEQAQTTDITIVLQVVDDTGQIITETSGYPYQASSTWDVGSIQHDIQYIASEASGDVQLMVQGADNQAIETDSGAATVIIGELAVVPE